MVNETVPLETVISLAKEIGFDLRSSDANAYVLGAYVLGLVGALRSSLDDHPGNHDPSCPARSIAGIMEASIISTPSAIVEMADAIKRHIQATDDCDGWPRCPWLYALKGCCLAVEFGIKHPENSRWPAEAGNKVADMVLGHGGAYDRELASQRRAWLRERLAEAVADPLKT